LAAFDITIGGRWHSAAGSRLQNAVLEASAYRSGALPFFDPRVVGIFGRCFWHETTLRLSIVGPNK
jgi:hypothetical protein